MTFYVGNNEHTDGRSDSKVSLKFDTVKIGGDGEGNTKNYEQKFERGNNYIIYNSYSKLVFALQY